jgi:hypothetical protein
MLIGTNDRPPRVDDVPMEPLQHRSLQAQRFSIDLLSSASIATTPI